MIIVERSVQRPWWTHSAVYQIYPASFKDSNGDGIGDIPGIVSKLDYIKCLGVDVIWLCPMYDSPQYDMGYDISDFEAVYPPYGTVSDVETLIQQCHIRGLRIILDLVINHTSHLHAWFQESRSSKDSPKRNWYIWRPARYDSQGNRKPPNNWRGCFGGSVWEWDELTQEYYLHLFTKEQPDLNWENETTRKAIYESAMQFWLRKGIDGFRVDTVNMYSKGLELADAPVADPSTEWQFAANIFCNGLRMHEFITEMNTVLTKYDVMTVGELPHTPDPARVLRYVSAKERQLNMVFQFDVVDVGMGKDFKYATAPFNYRLPDLKQAILRTQNLIAGTDAWTTAFLENHDQARSISRFASDDPKYRIASGKLLAMMLAALSGTLFIYQGQEIGMVNVPKDWPIEEYIDVESKSYYNMIRERTNDDPQALAAAMASLQHLARDNARTPMQWDFSPMSGFSTAKPWMRVNDSYREINVRQQVGDGKSVLSFWREMLLLRKQYADLFIYGRFEVLDVENMHTFTFVKEFKGRRALVVLNFSESVQRAKTPGGGNLTMLMGNVESPRVDFAPYEGRIYLVE